MAENYRDASPHLRHCQESRNCRLVKNEPGKASPTLHEPIGGHSYGFAPPRDVEGVSEALQWTTHVPSRRPEAATDFHKLNLLAMRRRCLSRSSSAPAKDSSSQRAGFSRRPRTPSCTPKAATDLASFSFGKRIQPSIPIDGIIENRYANEEEDAIDSNYWKYVQERKIQSAPLVAKMTRHASSRATVSMERRRALEQAPPKPMDVLNSQWRISKFKNVPSHFAREAGSAPPLGRSNRTRGEPCRVTAVTAGSSSGVRPPFSGGVRPPFF